MLWVQAHHKCKMCIRSQTFTMKKSTLMAFNCFYVEMIISWIYLLRYVVCVCVSVWVCAQSILALHNTMDCNPLGSTVCGIFQARILEWGAISSSRGSSLPRDQTHISCVFWFDRQIIYQLPHLGSPHRINFTFFCLFSKNVTTRKCFYIHGWPYWIVLVEVLKE